MHTEKEAGYVDVNEVAANMYMPAAIIEEK